MRCWIMTQCLGFDVEQEVNGLYTYDRKPKFDMGQIRKINLRRAKIEE